MYGADFDPVMKAAKLAVELDREAAENKELIPTAIDKWLKIGEFTNGKVQSITLSGDPENPIVPKIDTSMPIAEATRVYQEMIQARQH